MRRAAALQRGAASARRKCRRDAPLYGRACRKHAASLQPSLHSAARAGSDAGRRGRRGPSCRVPARRRRRSRRRRRRTGPGHRWCTHRLGLRRNRLRRFGLGRRSRRSRHRLRLRGRGRGLGRLGRTCWRDGERGSGRALGRRFWRQFGQLSKRAPFPARCWLRRRGACLPCGPGGRAAGGDASAENQGRKARQQRPGSAGHARVGVVARGADVVPRLGRRPAVGAFQRRGGGAARAAGRFASVLTPPGARRAAAGRACGVV